MPPKIQSKLLLLLENGEEDRNTSSKTVKFYKENLESVLSQVGTLPISIISVAGPAVPASFLLLYNIINNLQAKEEDVSQLPPITWGEEAYPPQDKTGTWILSRPIPIQKSAILILYSQSREQDFLSEDSIMNALVGLDLRLSSLTVITSMDKLSLEFLSKVATFIKYGKEGEATPQNLIEELAFLIPNWSLVSRFPLGKEGGQTLLQKMLSISPEIDDAIFKHFPTVHSYLAPNIGESLADPEKDFIASLETFLSQLISSESLEKIVKKGKRITPTELKNIIKTHLEKLNLSIEIQSSREASSTSSQPASEYASKLAFFQKLNEDREKQNPSKEKSTSSLKKSSAPPASQTVPNLSKRPPAPPQPPPRPRPAKLFEEGSLKPIKLPAPIPPLKQKITATKNDTKKDAIDPQSRASVQEMVKQGIKKYQALMSSLIKKNGRDYLTEAELEKLHFSTLKKVLESFSEEEEEKKTALEKKLKAQLERELSSLKQQHEENRQLFLEDLIAELVLKYKSDCDYKSRLEQESTGSWKQRSKKMISNLVADLKDTLKANQDEDDWALLQLESRLGKLEGKFEAVKETDMAELSELTEMGIDFAVNDYKKGMEKFLGEGGKSLEEMHKEVKEKCLEELEETLGKEWDNDVEKKLEDRLLELYQEFEEKFQGKDEKKTNGKKSNDFAKFQTLIRRCLQEYQSIMKEEMDNVGSSEELRNLHEAAYHRAMMVMQTVHLAQTDPVFIQNYMTELKSEIESAFEEIWELYNLKEGREALKVKGEVRKCVELYEDEMDKHLRANEFIKKEELERLHRRVTQRILEKHSCKLTGDQEEELIQRMEELFVKCVEQNVMDSQNEPAIGIDLGTTYCCTAIYAKGKVHVIPNGIGKNTTPSYVAFRDGKKEVIGEAAKSQAYANPENTIFDAKRIIGRKFGDKKLQEDMALWPFSVVDELGIPKIKVGERNLHPEEISAKLLRQLKRDAENYLNEEVRKAVITVPAYFTDGQRQATMDAGKMAGLQVLFILSEPTAAALAYKLQHSSQGRERNVLIFDLGGGTFDVAVMKTSKGKIDILAVDGDTHLGGQDFDRSLMIYCAKEFKKEHKIDLFAGKDEKKKQKRDEVRRKLQRLQAECEKRKIELTSARAAEVCVDNMHGDIDLSVLVTRETFENLNAPLFQRTIEIVGRALESAGLEKGEIDDVVLVGGSTGIPIVQEMLNKYFGGKTLDCSINPDEAVAFGAAMKAAMMNGGGEDGSIEGEEIQDVTAMSIGVQVYGGGFSHIIPKGTKIPVKAMECYTTAHDDQTSVQITIFQGEEKVAVKNEKLGEFFLIGIPARKAGVEIVDVEMVINSQGILKVAAVNKSTGLREVSVIENKQRLAKEAIEAYLQLEGETSSV